MAAKQAEGNSRYMILVSMLSIITINGCILIFSIRRLPVNNLYYFNITVKAIKANGD